MNTDEQIVDEIQAMLATKQVEVCLSGGATGADSYWSQLWHKYTNNETLHYSFQGHNAYCNKAAGMRVIVPESYLILADSALKTAKKTNGRNFPCRSTKTNNLLRRNYYQVQHSQAMYAVSKIEYGVVSGGTNWAVQMFIDNHMATNPFSSCPCYVYDQLTNQWYQWVYDMWQPIDASIVPTPEGIWTGIGSRDLTPEATKAIEALWQRQQHFQDQ